MWRLHARTRGGRPRRRRELPCSSRHKSASGLQYCTAVRCSTTQQQQLAKSAACHEHQLVTSISFSLMIGRGPGLLGGARLQLRDVGGMVYMYFLFALVLFAALTNITAMDNDGREVGRQFNEGDVEEFKSCVTYWVDRLSIYISAIHCFY